MKRFAWKDSLVEIAEHLQPTWIPIRRHLHRHPELSGHEFETTRYLAETLDSLGIPPKIIGDATFSTDRGRTGLGRGLTADLITSPDLSHQKLFAIRGDIDALPIEDGKSVGYRSCRGGVMHACGHDVHATIVVAALQILQCLHRDGVLPHPIAVRGIFQPAEETAEGARYMISHRALNDVDAILGLHVDPTRSVGRVGLRPGAFTAAADLFEIQFRGRGGHGARPHLCRDPIDAATMWVQSAYRCLARVVNPHDTVVISVGQIQAGQNANVIPDSASLRGSLRSLNTDARQIALEKLNEVSCSVQQQTGCNVTWHPLMSAPGVVNDARLTDDLATVATEVVDPAAVQWIDYPSMGSEDFSFYLDQHRGAMFRLGVAGPQTGHEPLHTPNFDIDERAIAVGAKLMAAMAIQHFAPD